MQYSLLSWARDSFIWHWVSFEGRRGTALKAGFSVLLGLAVACLPCPEGVDINAWRSLAVFVSCISGMALRLAPMGCIALMALAVTVSSGLASSREILASFAEPTPWLVLCAFLLARAVKKSGLGLRLSWILIRFLGKSALGLAYALSFAELLLGAAMPSMTARSGGIIFPIVQSLCESLGARPGTRAGSLGAYIMQMCNQTTYIVSAIFITGMASNMLLGELAMRTAGVELSWRLWFLAASLPGLCALLLMPPLLLILEKPLLRDTSQARELARRGLEGLGPLSRAEKITLAVFLGALFLWSSDGLHGLGTTAVAMNAVAVLLAGGVLSWDECLSEKNGWDCFFWVAALMQLTALIARGGALEALVAGLSAPLSGLGWELTLPAVLALYMYSHYCFASITAHITALYPPFLLLCLAAGVPPLPAALALAMTSSLCGGLTNYSTAHSAIWFSAGYTGQIRWCMNGFICSLANLFVFLGIGAPWWYFLGLFSPA